MSVQYPGMVVGLTAAGGAAAPNFTAAELSVSELPGSFTATELLPRETIFTTT